MFILEFSLIYMYERINISWIIFEYSFRNSKIRMAMIFLLREYVVYNLYE
jgi:hypothetical protein